MYRHNKPMLDYSNIDHWWDHGYTGKGVKIAVFEGTPIDINSPMFEGRVFDTVGDMHKSGVENTHCHNIVATLLTVAPEAKVYVYKSRYYHKRALQKAWEDGCRIVNLSASRGSNSNIISEPEKEAFNKGMLLVTSAGNYYDCMKGESLLPYWLSVGAVDLEKDSGFFNPSDIEKYDYSSTGEELDLVNFSGIQVKNRHDTTTYFGGTSAACPYTVGMFALFYQRFKEQHGRFPEPDEAWNFLFENCKDLKEKGHDQKTGYGLLVLPYLWETEKDNHKAVKMAKPNGKTVFVHRDHVEYALERKGYKIFS